MTRVGVTLPSFRDTPEPALAVARAAGAGGLDAVFAYDHLFRASPAGGEPRPALACHVLLAAVAVEVPRVALGSLVVRATLRPPLVLRAELDTLQRVAGSRLLVTIGAGDRESRAENESYGLGFGTLAERIGAVRASVEATRGRGYPVWVGGSARHLAPVVALGDGWNRWGIDVEGFASELSAVRAAVASAGRDPGALTPSWGGLAVLGATDAAARVKAERLGAPPGAVVGGPATVAGALARYAEAGARWVVVGPVDSSDPDNASRLGEEVAPLLR